MLPTPLNYYYRLGNVLPDSVCLRGFTGGGTLSGTEIGKERRLHDNGVLAIASEQVGMHYLSIYVSVSLLAEEEVQMFHLDK